MLQKQYRLPAAIRLKTIASFSQPTFVLKIGKNDLPYSRFGFVVSKAVDKRATTRNRIRRVFRSCIEALFADITPGKDMLFFLKVSILEKKREDLYNEVRVFLKEQHLIQ